MINRIRIALVLLFVLWVTSTALAQGATATKPVLLTVNGEVATSLKLTADDLAKLPRIKVQAKDHDGKVSSFEGIELAEILKLAGVKFGEHLRGKDLALYLVVSASDSYKAVFALPELDHAFTDQTILLADRRDEKPLSEKEGPLRIVVPNEKRPARWVRQVTELTIRRAP